MSADSHSSIPSSCAIWQEYSFSLTSAYFNELIWWYLYHCFLNFVRTYLFLFFWEYFCSFFGLFVLLSKKESISHGRVYINYLIFCDTISKRKENKVDIEIRGQQIISLQPEYFSLCKNHRVCDKITHLCCLTQSSHR